MGKTSRRVICGLAATLLLAGCGFPVRNEKVDGPYRLFAADVVEQTSLSYDLGGDALAGRVSPTVFAAGWNADYVVAARHPCAEACSKPDRGRTEYFYVIRAKDGPGATDDAVRGPFDEAGFEAERRRLGLPPLTIKVAGLD